MSNTYDVLTELQEIVKIVRNFQGQLTDAEVLMYLDKGIAEIEKLRQQVNSLNRELGCPESELPYQEGKC